MGKQNRQRREQKKRQRASTGRGTPPFGGPSRPSGSRPFGESSRVDDDHHDLESALDATIRAALLDDPDGLLDRALAHFEQVALQFGINTVPELLATAVTGALHEAWHRGWQPADLLCVLRKQTDDATLDLTALAVIDEADHWDLLDIPPTWARQIDELRDGPVRAMRTNGFNDPVTWLAGHPFRTAETRRAALRVGAFLLATLNTIPNIPLLTPDPCAWPRRTETSDRSAASSATAGLDPALLAKVRVNNRAGFIAGQVAAEQARIGPDISVTP